MQPRQKLSELVKRELQRRDRWELRNRGHRHRRVVVPQTATLRPKS
jgi:hypothetical protein